MSNKKQAIFLLAILLATGCSSGETFNPFAENLKVNDLDLNHTPVLRSMSAGGEMVSTWYIVNDCVDGDVPEWNESTDVWR